MVSLFGFWLLAVGCWLLAVGCWLLAVGCWHWRETNPLYINDREYATNMPRIIKNIHGKYMENSWSLLSTLTNPFTPNGVFREPKP